MQNLKIEHKGSTVQGVTLRGDRNDPEPESFRVTLPFGDVDIVRQDDGEYWVHLYVHRPERPPMDGQVLGAIKDARIDLHGKHASETIELAAQINDPATYHVAVRVGPSAT